jgi:hypothetical protein
MCSTVTFIDLELGEIQAAYEKIKKSGPSVKSELPEDRQRSSPGQRAPHFFAFKGNS